MHDILRTYDIKRMLLSLGINIPNCHFTDSTYLKPTKKWLLGSFSKTFKKKVFGWSLWKWKPSFDCDNFSTLFYSFAQVCHAKSINNDIEGLTVGEFWYKDKNSGYHAINICIVENREIIFIEPQTCKEKTLTEEEIKSCTYCRF